MIFLKLILAVFALWCCCSTDVNATATLTIEKQAQDHAENALLLLEETISARNRLSASLYPTKDPTLAMHFARKVPLPSNESEVVQDIQQQQYPNVITSIVGGYDASGPRAPWMILLLSWNGRYWTSSGCGASLLNEQYAMTAAHCVINRSIGAPGAVYVHAFRPFHGNDGVPFHFSRIRRTLTHPNFNETSYVYDVALLELERVANTTIFEPLSLAKSTPEVSTLLHIFGFGRVGENNAQSADTLQEARVPLWEAEDCQRSYPRVFDPATMICAGNGNQDACSGDSGGPLAQTSPDGTLEQVGIISWGAGCARPDKPGVYTSVHTAAPWIKSIICASFYEDTAKDASTGRLCGLSSSRAVMPTSPPSLLLTPSPSTMPTLAPSLRPRFSSPENASQAPTSETFPPTESPSLRPTFRPMTTAPTTVTAVDPPEKNLSEKTKGRRSKARL